MRWTNLLGTNEQGKAWLSARRAKCDSKIEDPGCGVFSRMTMNQLYGCSAHRGLVVDMK
jgi:hypothetical protein